MFLIQRPNMKSITTFLANRDGDHYSYGQVGATLLPDPPHGFNIDHNRVEIGLGAADFERAKYALRRWEMFNLGWVELFDRDTPIEAGQTVAILVRHFGFYSLNAARIVYTIDDAGEIERYGFAYGTLTEHGEIGEERFSVEFHKTTGEVWYDLYAFSRPGSLLAKLGYPLSRYLQKAFARDSKHAMASVMRARNEE
jgi:uncharacterized protein (UPF0548 family)